jgi:hypothetical protein
VPSLEELRHDRALGVDLNAEHLDCWMLDPAGNPLGAPHTIPLELAGLEASTRDGRLRAAVAAIIRLAKDQGCRSVVVENLDFTDARQQGRERLGRGARGKRFRRIVAGIPTRRFRDLLVGMAANAGLWVVAVDLWIAASELPTPPGGPRPLPCLWHGGWSCPSPQGRKPEVREDSGQGHQSVRPGCPSGMPSETRRHRTVRCHRRLGATTRCLPEER